MIYIGIDVGVTGAVAAVNAEGGFVSLSDLPLTNFGKFKWTDGLRLLRLLREIRMGGSDGLKPARAYVEFVNASPQLGSKTASSMGRTFGSVVASVQIAGISLELVSPQKWKKALNVTSDKDSTLSLARARWPEAELDLVKHHNRAEALLIAEYGRRFNQGGV